MTTDYALLERARAYDEQAIAELYDRYAPKIYAYLYRRVSSVQLAEDLTADVFVRVLQAIQSEQFWHTSFNAWLYRIAHNLVVDYYRRQPEAIHLPLDEQLVADSQTVDSELAEKFSFQRLRSAIGQLTAGQQEVLALRFGERLSTQETAEVMGKTVGAIEGLQHRALTALRKVAEDDEL